MHSCPKMRPALLSLLMMLAGCANPTKGTDPGAPTISGRPAACLSLDIIEANRGKPGGATTEDISAALDRDMPVARVRNLVGDTDPTLRQIDHNNAAVRALCNGGRNGGSGDH